MITVQHKIFEGCNFFCIIILWRIIFVFIVSHHCDIVLDANMQKKLQMSKNHEIHKIYAHFMALEKFSMYNNTTSSKYWKSTLM